MDEFKNLNKDQLEIAVMVRLKQVADDIVKMLEFTHDQPSSHSEKWMPVLDLQVRPENGQLQFKYYEKDCSNSQVIAARSAMNMTDKMTSLIQEGLRRMLNTSQSLPPNVIKGIMEDFVVKMWRSGYSHKVRKDVVHGAVAAYECRKRLSEADQCTEAKSTRGKKEK